MKQGSGMITKSVVIEYDIECGLCPRFSSIDVPELKDAKDYYKKRGWLFSGHAHGWVCPRCASRWALNQVKAED